MEKAKLIRSITERCFNEHFLIYEYEYRGYRYTVYVNLNKGNEPLYWQHRNEQNRIDSLIELENKAAKQEKRQDIDKALKELFEYWNA